MDEVEYLYSQQGEDEDKEYQRYLIKVVGLIYKCVYDCANEEYDSSKHVSLEYKDEFGVLQECQLLLMRHAKKDEREDESAHEYNTEENDHRKGEQEYPV